MNENNYVFKKIGRIILLFFIVWIVNPNQSQAQNPQGFEIEIEPLVIPEAPGVHSFAWAIDSLGRWLVLGGRVDGLHQRQPFAAFLPSDNNTQAYVIDSENEQVWSTSLSSLPATIFEQLQSTNQEFTQRDNQLYVIGGYGYSATMGDHITYPYLTAINVNEVTETIVSGANDLMPHFRQIENEKLAVTGGVLGYLDTVFYLAGGHLFEGRYNPMGPNHGPGFIQEYTDAIRKFKVLDDGINLSITDFSETIDTNNLHRRDYNMVPQFFPNGEVGFTMFSGVFQKEEDLPFLNSVDITPDGFIVNNSFNQYLSQYHSARIPIFDVENNVMHTLFFGGMSQYTLDENGNLVEDENVPFVKTISRVSRFADGTMEEVKLDIEMPVLVGAGAEFIPLPSAPFMDHEILNLMELSEQRSLVGYIYGGIESSQDNIFFINDGSQSIASNVIFKVFVKKSIATNTSDLKVDGSHTFGLKVYPNPTDSQVVVEFTNAHKEQINIALTDANGKKIKTIFQGEAMEGLQKKLFDFPEVAGGMYFITIENSSFKNVKTIFLE